MISRHLDGGPHGWPDAGRRRNACEVSHTVKGEARSKHLLPRLTCRCFFRRAFPFTASTRTMKCESGASGLSAVPDGRDFQLGDSVAACLPYPTVHRAVLPRAVRNHGGGRQGITWVLQADHPGPCAPRCTRAAAEANSRDAVCCSPTRAALQLPQTTCPEASIECKRVTTEEV